MEKVPLRGLFFNVPAYGHVLPTLPLVAELNRRGHHITYFSTESFRPHLQAVGAEVQMYEGISDTFFHDAGLVHGGVQKVASHFMETTGEILPKLLEDSISIHPDYVLYDGMCVWGYFVAKVLKLPSVASYPLLAPFSPPPKAMLNGNLLRVAIPPLYRAAFRHYIAYRRALSIAKEYGVKRLGFTSLLNVPADLALSYCSEYFQPFVNTVPDYVRFIGWTLIQQPDSSPDVMQGIMGKPLIYISLGTITNQKHSFFEQCIKAFADQDVFVLISTGKSLPPGSFQGLPDNISIQSWVPQSDVLQRASLFITHGGMNSILDGAYCGLPFLLVPQQVEQVFNALRVVELGAGLMLNSRQCNPRNLRDFAWKLLEDPLYRIESNRIGDSLREAGGVMKGADEIEGLLGKNGIRGVR